MKYTIQVWYRSRDQKDFEIYEVEAIDEPQAIRKALDMHKIGIPFKTEIYETKLQNYKRKNI